ncbi:MAG: ABC transporter ATP-binding protein [Nitrospirae bacterium RBG_13_39_12]|nr:MAG: ABC transporter ATP-binding protein [Nitrospirae bacterium RBG_13_39_12]
MLKVQDLWVSVGDRKVLKGVNFSMEYGEIHTLFGPNGAGKTSFMMTLMGFPKYRVEQGKIYFKGEDITGKDVHERAHLGLGISFQRPPTVRGVTLKKMIEIIADKELIKEEISETVKKLNLSGHLDRGLNDGFSGGEMKRSELLQLMVQRPDMVLIDEPESGVDIENIALVGEAINTLLGKDKVKDQKRGAIIITHTGYILDFVNTDKGYIIIDGNLVCGGNPRDILSEIKKHGYRRCVECR